MRRAAKRWRGWLLALGPLFFSCFAPCFAQASGPLVSIGISSGRATPRQLAQFRTALAERLREEGFEVVAAAEDADVALSLVFRDPGWLVRAVSADQSLDREVACGIELADDRLEVIQKATELVRKAQLATPVAAASPSGPAAAATLQMVDVDSVRPQGARHIGEISVGIDGLIRGANLDPLARIGWRFAVTPEFGLRLDLGLTAAHHDEVRLFEEQVLVGVGYRLGSGLGLSFEIAAMGGILVHEYGPDGGRWYSSIDRLGEVVVIGGVKVSHSAYLELRVATGWRNNTIQGVDSGLYWVADQFRVEAGVGVDFR